MLVTLSPAMNMKREAGLGVTAGAGSPDATDSPAVEPALTQPLFRDDAKMLADTLQGFGPLELESLLSTTPGIAMNAYEDYCGFAESGPGAPALLSFKGLAYKNLQPEDFDAADFDFANKRLRILSALYGILRPSDAIHPYRLDFMCRFAKGKGWGERLYSFWGSRVHDELFKTGEPVVNLCSAEYSKLIEPYLEPCDEFISCRFLETDRGELVCRATASKMARGQMARFIVKNRIDDPEGVKDFDWGGYRFSPAQSHSRLFVFNR